MRGTCKTFFEERGFGFLTPDAGGTDIFVHASVLHRAGIKELRVGDQIEFEVVRDAENRERAVAVRML